MYDKLMAGTTGFQAALRPSRRMIASANMLMRFANYGNAAPDEYVAWATKAARIVVDYLDRNIVGVAEMFGQVQADRILGCYAGYLDALQSYDRRALYRGCPLRYHNCLVDFICYRARQILASMHLSYSMRYRRDSLRYPRTRRDDGYSCGVYNGVYRCQGIIDNV